MNGFSDATASWFASRYGEPTDIQSAAWPLIEEGKNVLLSAPTGSGKTLAAFLYAIDQLACGRWALGGTRVLYVSPLKALNNDIRRNLLAPLEELREAWPSADFPEIRVMTRSGDTPQSERERMRRRPPEILITTPESLNLLLSSPRSLDTLCEIRSIILDEIHAVAGSKRGTHLITAVERLTELAGEVQRIGISATVRPVQTIADFVAGYRSPRGIEVVDLGRHKVHKTRVRFPAASEEPTPPTGGEPFWERLVPEVLKAVLSNRSTLIFTTNRRHAEKLALRLNQDQGRPIAYAHHGSLSREVRLGVEARLKAGELRAIVATSSLELGIDVGAVEEVLFFGTPLSLTSALQMAGRAGHSVGAVSRSTFFPLFGRDLIDAAVAATAIHEGWIEETRPPSQPLDVLAQIIVSMAGTARRRIDDIHALLRRCHPYRDLSRRTLDLVLEMLAGKYAETRIRELGRRVFIDRLRDEVSAPKDSLRLIYHSGGTIPDRGYYGLKVRGSTARLGELDEEFVWERKIGESFVFGNNAWKITAIGDRDVEVIPAGEAPRILPFWKGESIHRRVEYADRVRELLRRAEEILSQDATGDGEFSEALCEHLAGACSFDDDAAETLSRYVVAQRRKTKAALPHSSHLIVEETRPLNSPSVRHVVVVTLFGGAVNYPLGLLILDQLEQRLGPAVSVFSDNDSVVVQVDGEELTGDELLRILRSLPRSYQRVESVLRRRLEGSGLFGTRFRENAGRALLLPRPGFDRRTPLWINRMRARGLLQAVSEYDDFPITAETWRSCLEEDFDIPALLQRVALFASGAITISVRRTQSPSPMARTSLWQHTNLRMYETDEPRGATRGSSLSGELLREVAMDPRLRPAIPQAVRKSFQARLHRLLPGYPPRGIEELVDWVKERLAIPLDEWRQLIDALPESVWATEDALPPDISRIESPAPVIVATERLKSVRRLVDHSGESGDAGSVDGAAEGPTQLTLFLEWLAFYGPVTPAFVAEALGVPESRVDTLVREAAEEEHVVTGLDAEDRFCDYRNYESLLRILRSRSRGSPKPLPPESILPFLVSHRRQVVADAGGDYAAAILGAFEGYAAPFDLWESDLLPRIIPDYQPRMAEDTLRRRALSWMGAGRRRLLFVEPSSLDLILDELHQGHPAHSVAEIRRLMPSATGWHPFVDLLESKAAGFGADNAGPAPPGAGATVRGPGETAALLVDAAWEGAITSDSLQALRRETALRKAAPSTPGNERLEQTRRPGGRRPRFGSRPTGVRGRRGTLWDDLGLWRLLPSPAELFRDYDAYELEELRRDRARLLLDRYGFVSREMATQELHPLSWRSLFRSLRLMELSGEVVGGIFFHGLSGIQFARPEVAEALSRLTFTGTHAAGSHAEVASFCLNAMDPLSPCARGIQGLPYELPPRVGSTTLHFHDTALVALFRRGGSEVTVFVAPDDSRMTAVIEEAMTMVQRGVSPPFRLRVSTINGVDAAESVYAPRFETAGFTKDRRELVLWAGYR